MKHILKRQVLILAAIFLLNISNAQIAQAASKKSGVYTLYRNSGITTNARIHIATFDSKEISYGSTNEDYNRYNCKLAAKLFMSQPNVITTFWCEKGFSILNFY